MTALARDARWPDEHGIVAALPQRERHAQHLPLTRDAFETVARLSQRRTDLQQQLGALLGVERPGHAGQAADHADAADDQQRRQSEVHMAGILLAELQQVERALRRAVSGEYGCCEECGDPIPPRRLERLPATTRCVTCQEHHEARGG